MEDFKVASTRELSKLLKNIDNSQKFLDELIKLVDTGEITSNQYCLIQPIAIKVLTG